MTTDQSLAMDEAALADAIHNALTVECGEVGLPPRGPGLSWYGDTRDRRSILRGPETVEAFQSRLLAVACALLEATLRRYGIAVRDEFRDLLAPDA